MSLYPQSPRGYFFLLLFYEVLYGRSMKQFPRLTVDAIVQREDGALLFIKRGCDPYKGTYALPGGFVEYGETVEDACLRELKEETNLEGEIKSLLGVYSDPRRDPRFHTVSIIFVVKVKKFDLLRAGDDASDYSWIRDVQGLDLAFDHEVILKDFLRIEK